MARTNIDLDDVALGRVMLRYGFATKRDAVNHALQVLAAEALDPAEAVALKGSGWEGDLDAMRGTR